MAMLCGLREDCFLWSIPLKCSKYPHKSWINKIRCTPTSSPAPWFSGELAKGGKNNMVKLNKIEKEYLSPCQNVASAYAVGKYGLYSLCYRDI